MIQNAYRTVRPRDAKPPMQVMHPEHGLFIVEQVSIVADGIQVVGPRLGRGGKVRATLTDEDALQVVATFPELLAVQASILNSLTDSSASDVAVTGDGRLAVIAGDNCWYVDLLNEADAPAPPKPAEPRTRKKKSEQAAAGTSIKGADDAEG